MTELIEKLARGGRNIYPYGQGITEEQMRSFAEKAVEDYKHVEDKFSRNLKMAGYMQNAQLKALGR